MIININTESSKKSKTMMKLIIIGEKKRRVEN